MNAEAYPLAGGPMPCSDDEHVWGTVRIVRDANGTAFEVSDCAVCGWGSLRLVNAPSKTHHYLVEHPKGARRVEEPAR